MNPKMVKWSFFDILYSNLIKHGLAQHATMMPSSWLGFTLDEKGQRRVNLITDTRIVVVERMLDHNFTIMISVTVSSTING